MSEISRCDWCQKEGEGRSVIATLRGSEWIKAFTQDKQLDFCSWGCMHSYGHVREREQAREYQKEATA